MRLRELLAEGTAASGAVYNISTPSTPRGLT